jgi:hypothetical protein
MEEDKRYTLFTCGLTLLPALCAMCKQPMCWYALLLVMQPALRVNDGSNTACASFCT